MPNTTAVADPDDHGPREDASMPQRWAQPPTVTNIQNAPGPATGSGGLFGKWAAFGNATGIGLIFILFAVLVFYLVDSAKTGSRELIQYGREETLYQRQRHDEDMKALISEMKAGRETTDRRTEQQHQQIKDLHDLILKEVVKPK
jgi:hypothetical protein